MMAVGYYDKSDYDFTEETWRKIEFYEMLFSDQKRIANYKEGGIPEEFLAWVECILETDEVKNLIRFDFNIPILKKYRKSCFYATSRLNKVLSKNKYFMPKVAKDGLKFSIEDLKEFFIVLQEAKSRELLKEFLSVPDVWYILRNVKENWNDIVRVNYFVQYYNPVVV